MNANKRDSEKKEHVNAFYKYPKQKNCKYMYIIYKCMYI